MQYRVFAGSIFLVSAAVRRPSVESLPVEEATLWSSSWRREGSVSESVVYNWLASAAAAAG